MSYAAGVFLAIVAACVAIMIAVQVHEYVRGRTLLSPRHFALRMAAGALLLLVITGIYAGMLLPFGSPLTELAYWLGLVVVAVGAGFMAALDLRVLERVKHQQRAELYRSLAEDEARLRCTEGEDG